MGKRSGKARARAGLATLAAGLGRGAAGARQAIAGARGKPVSAILGGLLLFAATVSAQAQTCDPVFLKNAQNNNIPLNVAGLNNNALTRAVNTAGNAVVSTTISDYTQLTGGSSRLSPVGSPGTINYLDPQPASAGTAGENTFTFTRRVPVIFEAGSSFGAPDSNLDIDQDFITFTAIGASPGFTWVREPAANTLQTVITISPDGLTATVNGPNAGNRPGSFAQYRLSTNSGGTVTGVRFRFSTKNNAPGSPNSAQFQLVVPTCKPTLTLAKTVINDSGGTAADTAWTLAAAGPTPISGTEGSAAVTNAVVNAGTYTLSETGPAGYTQTGPYSCVVNGGAPVANNSVTLANLAVATCTVTNNDNPGTLRLIKNLASRAAATDEFATVILNGGTALAFSPPTTGATPATASTAATIVPAGVALTLRDAQTSGPSDIATAYTRAISCVAGPSNGTLPIPTPTGPTVADPNAEWSLTMNAGNDVVCTITNTAAVATLQLAKAWAAGSIAGHQVTIGPSTGGANNTVGFTATATTAANSGAPVNVNVGDVITLPAEGGANVASYSTALACTGGHTLSGTNGQQANTLTITSANPAVCTYTNTLRTVTLTLRKQWAGAIVGDDATITASRGGTVIDTFDSDAGAANELDTDATPTVSFVGDSLTLAETLAAANGGAYDTVLACTGAADTNPADGLSVGAADTAIVCTYTNTHRSTDLSITKTNTPAAGPLDQAGDTVNAAQTTTYTLVATNNGTSSITGAVVRDAPTAGITCASGNPVTITGNGVPPGSFTVADLTGAGGIVLATLATGQSATLSFDCQVN
ncbi:DUF11 domain-containing protein [Lysobacter capsici]|uniref:DUF11 domain-containing protein n=1 Tax=Lysobacter capsici TaxID=435897 RepID=UPI000BBADECC|nr:DUF11 domain-containing protein [Lysobacter capsici]ATE72267.1 hypothetical protein CNO08_13465 [Lysobacter capsici]